jgi:hypothetical protein
MKKIDNLPQRLLKAPHHSPQTALQPTYVLSLLPSPPKCASVESEELGFGCNCWLVAGSIDGVIQTERPKRARHRFNVEGVRQPLRERNRIILPLRVETEC